MAFWRPIRRAGTARQEFTPAPDATVWQWSQTCARSLPGSRPAAAAIEPRGAPAAGCQAKMQFVPDSYEAEPRPERRLQVALIERLNQHKDNEEGQDKVHDRLGSVLVAVIQRPVRHEGVEEIILDVPSAMARPPEPAGR